MTCKHDWVHDTGKLRTCNQCHKHAIWERKQKCLWGYREFTIGLIILSSALFMELAIFSYIYEYAVHWYEIIYTVFFIWLAMWVSQGITIEEDVWTEIGCYRYQIEVRKAKGDLNPTKFEQERDRIREKILKKEKELSKLNNELVDGMHLRARQGCQYKEGR